MYCIYIRYTYSDIELNECYFPNISVNIHTVYMHYSGSIITGKLVESPRTMT